MGQDVEKAFEHRRLKPLGHQLTGVFDKAGFFIERLRRGVFMADLQPQRRNAFTPADALGESDHAFAEFLAAKGPAQVKLIQQRETAVKFKAETECKREISSQL